MNDQKPIPLKTEDNHPFWDAADEHELHLQRCQNCDHYAHPPGPACPMCGSQDLVWDNFGSDIRATVYTYVISYRPFLPGFQDDLPLIIAQAELEQVPDVKIIANILDCPSEDVYVGMPVKMVWQDMADTRALPQWVPVK